MLFFSKVLEYGVPDSLFCPEPIDLSPILPATVVYIAVISNRSTVPVPKFGVGVVRMSFIVQIFKLSN